MLRPPHLLAFLAVAACAATPQPPAADDDDPVDPGGDAPDARPGGAEPVAYDALFGELAAVYCERVFACCTTDERRLIGIIPYVDERPEIPDVAACTTYMTEMIRMHGYIGQLAPAVESGALSYDGARAAACLDEFAALSCDAFGRSFDQVRNMSRCQPFVATKATGDACEYDQQCPTDYCFDAVCADKPAAGAPCPAGTCADGLFCDSFGDGTCQTPRADGAECVFHDDCASGYCGYENSKGDTGFCGIAADWVCDGP